MREIERFDSNLGMFVHPVRESSMNHLRELRWRAENGYFDRFPFSIPRGDNFFRLTSTEIVHYARQEQAYRDLQI